MNLLEVNAGDFYHKLWVRLVGPSRQPSKGEAFRRTWCVLEMAVATGLGEADSFSTPLSGFECLVGRDDDDDDDEEEEEEEGEEEEE